MQHQAGFVTEESIMHLHEVSARRSGRASSMIYNPSLRRLFNKLMLFANDFLKYRMHYGSNINLFISDDITVLKKTLTTKSVSSTQGRGRTKSEKKSTAAEMTETQSSKTQITSNDWKIDGPWASPPPSRRQNRRPVRAWSGREGTSSVY